MGWVDLQVGLGQDFAVFDGLGWVEYDNVIQYTIARDHAS